MEGLHELQISIGQKTQKLHYTYIGRNFEATKPLFYLWFCRCIPNWMLGNVLSIYMKVIPNFHSKWHFRTAFKSEKGFLLPSIVSTTSHERWISLSIQNYLNLWLFSIYQVNLWPFQKKTSKLSINAKVAAVLEWATTSSWGPFINYVNKQGGGCWPNVYTTIHKLM